MTTNSHNDSDVVERNIGNMIEQPSRFVTRCVSTGSSHQQYATGHEDAATSRRIPSEESNHSSTDANESSMVATTTRQDEEIITPTSLRSITLAGLYHSSRRSRHVSPQRSSGGGIISTPLPSVGSSVESHEWKEMENVINSTAKEEWLSFTIMTRQASFSSMEEDIDDVDMIGEVFDEDD